VIRRLLSVALTAWFGAMAPADAQLARRISTMGGGACSGGTVFNIACHPNWQAALAGVKSNTADAPVLVVGDSTAAGALCNAGSSTNSQPCAWPTLLATAATTLGYNSSADAMCADHGYAALVTTNDTRVVLTPNFTLGSGNTYSSFGGTMFDSTSAGTLAFTPAGSVDTFKIYYPQYPSGLVGTQNINIDGGSNTLVNTTGAESIATATISGVSAGTHTINTVWASGFADVICAAGFNSAQKRVVFFNGGISGAPTASYCTTTFKWSTLNSLAAGFSAKMIIIDLGINDMLSAIPLATSTANMQSIITSAKMSGADVVIKTFIPQQVGSISQATQTTYLAMLHAMAKSNGLQILDTNAFVGTWIYANSQSWMANNNHMLLAGNQAITNYMAPLLF
jgi:hypothetical protein